MGNPIEIGAVIVWQVSDTYRAAFEVADFVHYVKVQSEAAVRHLANSFPYDQFEDEHATLTLRDGGDKVNELLEKELNERLSPAGIIIKEARISHLAPYREPHECNAITNSPVKTLRIAQRQRDASPKMRQNHASCGAKISIPLKKPSRKASLGDCTRRIRISQYAPKRTRQFRAGIEKATWNAMLARIARAIAVFTARTLIGLGASIVLQSSTIGILDS